MLVIVCLFSTTNETHKTKLAKLTSTYSHAVSLMFAQGSCSSKDELFNSFNSCNHYYTYLLAADEQYNISGVLFWSVTMNVELFQSSSFQATHQVMTKLSLNVMTMVVSNSTITITKTCERLLMVNILHEEGRQRVNS